MGDLIRALVEIVQFLWPLRTVHTWERAGYYVCGKWWKEVGPGLKVVVPWFTHVETVSVAQALAGTGREDITLKDGSTLSFSAMATLRVVDVYKALNEVEHYHDSTQELIGSYLADKLAEVDPDRLTPEKRARLFGDLRRGLAAEAAEFGVEITKLRFTSLVTKVRTYRLLMDQGKAAEW